MTKHASVVQALLDDNRRLRAALAEAREIVGLREQVTNYKEQIVRYRRVITTLLMRLEDGGAK